MRTVQARYDICNNNNKLATSKPNAYLILWAAHFCHIHLVEHLGCFSLAERGQNWNTRKQNI